MSEAGRWQKGLGLERKQDCVPQHQLPNNPLPPGALRSQNQHHHLGTSVQTYKPEEKVWTQTIVIPKINWETQGEGRSAVSPGSMSVHVECRSMGPALLLTRLYMSKTFQKAFEISGVKAA